MAGCQPSLLISKPARIRPCWRRGSSPIFRRRWWEVQARQPATVSSTAARDLRSLLWSSIDNDSSRDLDQVEYVEQLPDGSVRLLVGIADVDASVPKGSATDLHAAAEATSVYTGVAIFPMLPGELSTDRTSLLDAQDRCSIVIELHVLASGEVTGHEVYPAWLRNRAKLAYSSTGAWLEGRGPIPSAVAAVPGMEAQLRLQLAASEKLRGHSQTARVADVRLRRNHAGAAKWRGDGTGGKPAHGGR